MLSEFADIAGVFMGIGEPYPKGDIVNFLTGTTGEPKSTWNNKSDAIYYSYTRAIREKNYPIYQPSDPAGNEKIINFVSAETGLLRNDVFLYLNALYTMAKMGKIKTEYWNPKGQFSAYGTSQVTAAIKQAIAPITQTASAPAKNLITGIIIAAGLTAIGIFASKEFIKQKTVKRKF